ncbi:MAG: glycosyltransferase family 4 protein [Candidatus Omnitrophota bacterium]|nr:MAG: glycosyltransferase family 4 protein [Candidatus Omnitrophota bacterium]
MRILLINKFLYPKGGAEKSTLEIGKLLSFKGHEVMFWGMQHPLNPEYPYKDYFVSRVDFDDPGNIKDQIISASNVLYSLEAKRNIERLIKIKKPDIVHLNNFAHQISPSILDVFKKYNIPMVMSIRDYKLVCASYLMIAKGKICEACKRNKYYQCFSKGCVKDSKLKSLLSTIEMYLHHKILHIYDCIDVFISPSKFLKSKVEEMGFKGRIIYLPNFANTEMFNPEFSWQEDSVVYFGRLSREKGLFTLLKAVKGLEGVSLKIIGEGPIQKELGEKVKKENIRNVYFLGYRKGEDLKNEIRKSKFVVLPSEWYENNPRSIIEGFAFGKSAIGARIGGIPELVKDGETGLTFEAASIEDLRSKIKCLFNNPDKIVKMGKNARLFVERELNPERHYQGLMQVYEQAARRRPKVGG